MGERPRIVLLHATTVAMSPVHQAFESAWPEAELVNLLDDGLTTERAARPELGEQLTQRFVALTRYAYGCGADAILVTCSAFGPAIDRAAAELPVPVVKPNEAMFRAALRHGPQIGMLATFAPSVPTMEAEFIAETQRMRPDAQMHTIVVPEAMDRLRGGDPQAHNRLLADRATDFADVDALVLAHFSTARAAADVRAAVEVPVFTAPDTAVDLVKQRLSPRSALTPSAR